MKQGELDNAKRRALNIFDAWNDITGLVPKHIGYYYELQGVVEDAVECGAQAALGVYECLECEAEGELIHLDSYVDDHHPDDPYPTPIHGTVELDSGYQMVCSVNSLKLRELADWLAGQVGYEFENGDKVTAIESFQVIREGPYNDCIAVCRVSRQHR